MKTHSLSNTPSQTLVKAKIGPFLQLYFSSFLARLTILSFVYKVLPFHLSWIFKAFSLPISLIEHFSFSHWCFGTIYWHLNSFSVIFIKKFFSAYNLTFMFFVIFGIKFLCECQYTISLLLPSIGFKLRSPFSIQKPRSFPPLSFLFFFFNNWALINLQFILVCGKVRSRYFPQISCQLLGHPWLRNLSFSVNEWCLI